MTEVGERILVRSAFGLQRTLHDPSCAAIQREKKARDMETL